MTIRLHTLLVGALAAAVTSAQLVGCGSTRDSVSLAEKGDRSKPGIRATRDIAEEAYIYGFPMIAAYKAMYMFNIDTGGSQYKAPFNQIDNETHVATPKDTAIVTPNSDTPYSMVQLDLRAEPMVLSVPAVDAKRYYSVQLVDQYTFNYGYIGSRATGDAAGDYMVVGPGWTGPTPPGIKQVFRSGTDFSLVIYRTQLFRPSDIRNVEKVQAGYRARPLSAYLKQPAPPQPPLPAFPAFTEDAFKTDFPTYLDFLLTLAPPVPEETAMRARFASIGIGPGKTFDWKALSLEHKAEIGLGIKAAFEKIQKQKDEIGKNENGWRVGSAFGDRAFYHGDYLLRAAAALAGVYGNDAVEAIYPMAVSDASGGKLDGRTHAYTITFPAGQYPPVNAFWSITMYDGKTQLLIENPIDRYLINSPMLPQMKKNADGSLTIYVQKDSPGPQKQSNWLPAPDGPIYMVMRLYWPKEAATSGAWQPPGIVPAS
ncbi:MAG TPA: DUF1254 domain-containing protein [Candidatus Binatia bacterium]|jgi:hypothetical protein|nr:DUF1254 domain-containing protein [Candidatus Binatia bacterium]